MEKVKNSFRKYDLFGLVWFIVLMIPSAISSISAPNKLYVPPEDPNSSFPRPKSETVPGWLLFVIAFAAPVIVVALLYNLQKKFPNLIRKFDFWKAIWAFFDNFALSSFFVTLFKNYVGRARPDYYDGMHDSSRGTNISFTGKPGYDENRSWPSGHSSIVFSVLFFAALFIDACVKLGSIYSTLIGSLCVILAFFIASSRIIDFRHHTDDVLAGSFFGVLTVFFTWKKIGKRCFDELYQEIEQQSELIETLVV